MKKIFTFLFTAAMLTSAFAQYEPKDEWNKKNWEDVYSKHTRHKHDNDDNRYKGGYYFTPAEREMQIAQIIRGYDYRIQSVKNNYFMSWYQKRRQIGFLTDQRDREIRYVYDKFNDPKNKCTNEDRWDKKRW